MSYNDVFATALVQSMASRLDPMTQVVSGMAQQQLLAGEMTMDKSKLEMIALLKAQIVEATAEVKAGTCPQSVQDALERMLVKYTG